MDSDSLWPRCPTAAARCALCPSSSPEHCTLCEEINGPGLVNAPHVLYSVLNVSVDYVYICFIRLYIRTDYTFTRVPHTDDGVEVVVVVVLEVVVCSRGVVVFLRSWLFEREHAYLRGLDGGGPWRVVIYVVGCFLFSPGLTCRVCVVRMCCKYVVCFCMCGVCTNS